VTISGDSSLIDVCFAVCTALDDIGTTVVLTGGSAATFYAPTAYQSRDADFVITMRGDASHGIEAMARLGYSRTGSIYAHESNRYAVDFPRGPLAVGEEIVQSWATYERRDERLYVLSRADSVRDRLSWFYCYRDRSALAAAVAVATSGDLDLSAIREWSPRVGEAAAFQEFADRVAVRRELHEDTITADEFRELP
jgi:hypothetical protein